MSEWRYIPAEEFCASVRDGTHDSPKAVSNGRLLVTSRNITTGRLDFSDAYLVSQTDFDSINKRSKVDQWDVLVSMIGTVGEPCLIKEVPNFVIKNIGLFKSKGETEGKWLYYYLRSPATQQLIRERSRGTTQQYIPLGALRQLPVILPGSDEEMRAITRILSALDDKIELNRRINETLEKLAHTIFQSWFVEAAKSAVPKGWRAGTLGEVAENPRRGIQPEQIKTDTAYIGLEHMPRRSIALSNWGHTEELVSNKFEFRCGEILFGKLRPYFHKVGVAPLDGVCSTDILVIRPKEPEWFGFVLGHVSSVELVDHTNAASTGTKMPRTNWNDISRYEVALPPKQLVAEFTEKIHPFVDQIAANIHESRTLGALRDALLPKLLSGELPVGQVEQ